MDDFDDAIVTKEEAVEWIPNDHPGRPHKLINLASALFHRFQTTGSMADLDRAVVTNEHAFDCTPHDHPFPSSTYPGYYSKWKSLGIPTNWYGTRT
jgi:hypothetical protein